MPIRAKMKQNNSSKLWIATAALCLTSCADDDVDIVSEQDQKMLDKAAKKLDDQMPEARAERMSKEQEEE